MINLTQPATVFFGVDYRRTNPYQSLLYAAAGQSINAVSASPEEALAQLPDVAGRGVYHLHWEDHIFRRMPVNEDRRGAVQKLLDDLDNFRAAGGRIIWTRHNLRPHEDAGAELHANMVPHLSKLADVTHVHSHAALEDLAQIGQANLASSAIIAHGNFANAYPEWSRAPARKELGFDDENLVFLLFGRQTDYKQTSHAAETFASIDDPEARLLIVGVGAETALGDVANDPRISCIDGFVADAEVGKYFAACDIALMPYSHSLTSGAALLAHTLGRGVLGVDAAGIRDVVSTGRTGLLYRQGDETGLSNALRIAMREGREVWKERGQTGSVVAAARDWAHIGTLWRALFQSLASEPNTGDLRAGRIGVA